MSNPLLHWVKDSQLESQEIDKALEQLKALLEGPMPSPQVMVKAMDPIELILARGQSLLFQMNGLIAAMTQYTQRQGAHPNGGE